MIDVNAIKYDVELIDETGRLFDLNTAILGLQWCEYAGELAQRATVTVANMAMLGTWFMGIAKINCIVRIYGKWNGQKEKSLLFEGTVWDWHYTSATEKVLEITAYDMAIRLLRSKEHCFYPEGMTTQAIIGDICKRWGIPFSYQWGQSLVHGKKLFCGKKTLADMIYSLLNEVQRQTGERYVLYYRDNELQIRAFGTNNEVYLLDRDVTASTSHIMTMNNILTRVKVIGRQDKEGRSPIEAIVDGDTRFGVMQEIIRRDSSKTIDEAINEANETLRQRGKPQRDINWQGGDLPFLRKGDRVQLEAGDLIGSFFVEGVGHCGRTRSMSLTLSYDLPKEERGRIVEVKGGSDGRYTVTYDKNDGMGEAPPPQSFQTGLPVELAKLAYPADLFKTNKDQG
jgi:hypothetical protein